MKLYRFQLLDIKGDPIMSSTKVYPTSRSAAYEANKLVDSIPPCMGFKIVLQFLKPIDAANAINTNLAGGKLELVDGWIRPKLSLHELII